MLQHSFRSHKIFLDLTRSTESHKIYRDLKRSADLTWYLTFDRCHWSFIDNLTIWQATLSFGNFVIFMKWHQTFGRLLKCCTTLGIQKRPKRFWSNVLIGSKSWFQLFFKISSLVWLHRTVLYLAQHSQRKREALPVSTDPLALLLLFRALWRWKLKKHRFREQHQSQILGVRKGRKFESCAEFPQIFMYIFVKVTKTVMMTPTLIGIMSDVRIAICQKKSVLEQYSLPYPAIASSWA